MSDTVRLNNHHRRTLQEVFQHPVSHDLEWRSVVALFEHLGSAEERENGNYIFEVNGISELFQHKGAKTVSDVEELLSIRHFLERVGVGPDTETTVTSSDSPGVRLLAVVSHQETLIFETEGKGSEIEKIKPYDPHGFRHQVRNKAGNSDGRSSEDPSYYHSIAKTLEGADEILLMGDATGSSSALSHLVEFLEHHYPLISKRIVGTIPGNIEAMTEREYLAAAREFCAAHNLAV